MNKISPDFLARSRDAFSSNLGMTLQELRDLISQTETGTSRRDLLSALDSAARLFGRALSQIPATATAVRSLFSSKSAAQLGVSEKRYQNIRSCVVGTVPKHAGGPQPITKRVPLSEPWITLLEGIEKYSYRMALNRLAAFCSFMAIPPKMVDRQVLLGFSRRWRRRRSSRTRAGS